jgi:hypothetical protein
MTLDRLTTRDLIIHLLDSRGLDEPIGPVLNDSLRLRLEALSALNLLIPGDSVEEDEEVRSLRASVANDVEDLIALICNAGMVRVRIDLAQFDTERIALQLRQDKPLEAIDYSLTDPGAYQTVRCSLSYPRSARLPKVPKRRMI